MPLTPDLPFPKSAADAIRSKDWNDHVKETQRLDTAKVNRSGDAVTGPLTIAGALGIGTPSPGYPLDVVATGEWPLRVTSSVATPSHRTHLLIQRSKGGAAVTSGMTLGGLAIGGHDGSNFSQGWNGGAEISAYAAENFTHTARGTGLTFATTATGTAGVAERMRIDASGNVGIGTAAPKAPLHVVGVALVSDGDGHAVPNAQMAKGSLTIGSTKTSFGGGTGWNPNTAGLLLETVANTEIAVHHSGSRLASIVQYSSNSLTIGRDMGWGTIASVVMNGNLGLGIPAPQFKVDVGGRIRLREGGGPSAGLWLYQDTPAEDRAFIGMANDNQVGLYGKGIGWGLLMDVTTGNVTIKGRCADANIRSSVVKNNKVDVTATAWVAMPDMSLVFTAAVSAHFQILVLINGVQAYVPNQGAPQRLGSYFRLLVDNNQVDMTRHEFHESGWELRGVVLSRLLPLGPGQHTVAVQWFTSGGTTSCCWYGDTRQIQVIEH